MQITSVETNTARLAAFLNERRAHTNEDESGSEEKQTVGVGKALNKEVERHIDCSGVEDRGLGVSTSISGVYGQTHQNQQEELR